MGIGFFFFWVVVCVFSGSRERGDTLEVNISKIVALLVRTSRVQFPGISSSSV
jgi:hypothetical protein